MRPLQVELLVTAGLLLLGPQLAVGSSPTTTWCPLLRPLRADMRRWQAACLQHRPPGRLDLANRNQADGRLDGQHQLRLDWTAEAAGLRLLHPEAHLSYIFTRAEMDNSDSHKLNDFSDSCSWCGVCANESAYPQGRCPAADASGCFAQPTTGQEPSRAIKASDNRGIPWYSRSAISLKTDDTSGMLRVMLALGSACHIIAQPCTVHSDCSSQKFCDSQQQCSPCSDVTPQQKCPAIDDCCNAAFRHQCTSDPHQCCLDHASCGQGYYCNALEGCEGCGNITATNCNAIGGDCCHNPTFSSTCPSNPHKCCEDSTDCGDSEFCNEAGGCEECANVQKTGDCTYQDPVSGSADCCSETFLEICPSDPYGCGSHIPCNSNADCRKGSAYCSDVTHECEECAQLHSDRCAGFPGGECCGDAFREQCGGHLANGCVCTSHADCPASQYCSVYGQQCLECSHVTGSSSCTEYDAPFDHECCSDAFLKQCPAHKCCSEQSDCDAGHYCTDTGGCESCDHITRTTCNFRGGSCCTAAFEDRCPGDPHNCGNHRHCNAQSDCRVGLQYCNTGHPSVCADCSKARKDRCDSPGSNCCSSTSAFSQQCLGSAELCSCDKHSDCALGSYCDDTDTCIECSKIHPSRCDTVDEDCCGDDFRRQCPNDHTHRCCKSQEDCRDCDVAAADRVACGTSLGQLACEARGCCYDDSVVLAPHCFQNGGTDYCNDLGTCDACYKVTPTHCNLNTTRDGNCCTSLFLRQCPSDPHKCCTAQADCTAGQAFCNSQTGCEQCADFTVIDSQLAGVQLTRTFFGPSCLTLSGDCCTDDLRLQCPIQVVDLCTRFVPWQLFLSLGVSAGIMILFFVVYALLVEEDCPMFAPGWKLSAAIIATRVSPAILVWVLFVVLLAVFDNAFVTHQTCKENGSMCIGGLSSKQEWIAVASGATLLSLIQVLVVVAGFGRWSGTLPQPASTVRVRLVRGIGAWFLGMLSCFPAIASVVVLVATAFTPGTNASAQGGQTWQAFFNYLMCVALVPALPACAAITRFNSSEEEYAFFATDQGYQLLASKGVPRPQLFLWAYRSYQKLAGLLFPLFWMPYMANELGTFFFMLRREDARGSGAQAVLSEPVSADGVRALSPIVLMFNICASGALGYGVCTMPIAAWSPFMFVPLVWVAVVILWLLAVTVALVWSLSEPRKRHVTATPDGEEARTSFLRASIGLANRSSELDRPAGCCGRFRAVIVWATSWEGQTWISCANHSVSAAMLLYGLLEYSDAIWSARIELPWLMIGALITSGVGLLVSLLSLCARKWPQYKLTPADDSFRAACLFKTALVMLKAFVVVELGRVDQKSVFFQAWEVVITSLFFVSLLVVALMTLALSIRKVWKQPVILEAAGVDRPRWFLAQYVLSYTCVKLAAIFLMLQGYTPTIFACYDGSKASNVIHYIRDIKPLPTNWTGARTDYGNAMIPDKTSCVEVFFGGNAGSYGISFVSCVSLAWLPLAVYANNEVAKMIDGVWWQHEQSLASGEASQNAQISTALHGYRSVAALLHAMSIVCSVGAVVVCFGSAHDNITTEAFWCTIPSHDVHETDIRADAVPIRLMWCCFGGVFALNGVMLIRLAMEFCVCNRARGPLERRLTDPTDLAEPLMPEAAVRVLGGSE